MWVTLLLPVPGRESSNGKYSASRFQYRNSACISSLLVCPLDFRPKTPSALTCISIHPVRPTDFRLANSHSALQTNSLKQIAICLYPTFSVSLESLSWYTRGFLSVVNMNTWKVKWHYTTAVCCQNKSLICNCQIYATDTTCPGVWEKDKS